MALARTLAVVRASEPCSSGSRDQHGLGRTHGQRRPQPRDLAVGRHRHQADLAAAGRVDELERHLDAVAVRLVEDELALALQRVRGRVQRAGLRPDPGSASHRRRRSWPVIVTDRSPAGPDGSAGRPGPVAPGRYRDYRGWPRAPPAGRQLVRLLGHRPEHGRRAPGAVAGARRADRRDEPPWPRHAVRAGRGEPRRRRGRGLRRRRHGQRGGAAGIADTHTALAVLPGGSTNVFARSIGLPNDPVAAAKELVPALKERHFRRVGLGHGQRPLLLLPHRRRLRRRRRPGGREARLGQAVGGPPALHLRSPPHVVLEVRPDAAPLRGGAARRRDLACRTATSPSCSTPAPTRTSATAPSTSAPTPTSSAGWWPSRSAA